MPTTLNVSVRTFIYVSSSASGEIYRYRLDPARAELSEPAVTATGGIAGPAAINAGRRLLYLALRNDPFNILTYAIDPATGDLDLLSATPGPATLSYISLDATGRFLFGASYHGDSICVLPIGPSGMVQPVPVAVLKPGRNPHAILADHSNRFVFVPCLGSDVTAQYLFDERTGELTPNRPPLVASAREAGPRHLVVSPDNRFIHLLTELGGTVTTYYLDPSAGILTEKASLSFIPADAPVKPGTYTPPLNATGGGNSKTPVVWAADIRVTPDGRFVYASERTTSLLARLKVDVSSGRLDFVDAIETEKQPRAFNLDSKGRFMVVAGEASGQVSLYAVDRDTGELRHTCRRAAGEKPNWVEIVDL